ncbi:MAG: hypothetical protein DCC65_06105 [Planctomycetota bacterium]|nr:MAG: hypothetical protein DCC65_06105 [Planctomycetota bacterium]
MILQVAEAGGLSVGHMLPERYSISTDGQGVGYGTRSMGHPKCRKTSIGCGSFMSKIFNE